MRKSQVKNKMHKTARGLSDIFDYIPNIKSQIAELHITPRNSFPPLRKV